MLRNYFAVALRNLRNHKLYSAINIGGLAVGLAACLLILLFVLHETSYERWLPRSERIALVEVTFTVPGRDELEFNATPGPLKEALEKDFSSDIERAVRIYEEDEPVQVGDRRFLTDISYVDPGFFEVFDLPMVEGQREAALANNASVLLSQSLATSYFGSESAVGKTIAIDDLGIFTVVGVMQDMPDNTHLDLDAIALFDVARYVEYPSIAVNWTSANVRTYVLFRSAEARSRVAADLPAFVNRNVREDVVSFPDTKMSELLTFEFMPLRDIHLHATKPGYRNTGSLAAVAAFAGIAVLILIIACINFVNLATARAMQRAREVAVRKVVGATRAQLIRQHLGEALLTAFIALILAVALIEMSLPLFNAFVDKQLSLDWFGSPGVAAAAFVLVIVVGLLGGLYPAVYLSRYRPARVLKANQSAVSGSSRLRTGLVVFQFAVSITLIICAATIYTQTIAARTFDNGFEADSRLVVSRIFDLPAQGAATFEQQVSGLPGVKGASLSSDVPPLNSNNNTLLSPSPTADGRRLVIETLRVDPDFFSVYEVEPIAGRVFSIDQPADFEPSAKNVDSNSKQSIVINRALAAKLGARRAEDVIGTVLYEQTPAGHTVPTTIIGVVPDLHLRSVRAAITPMLYYGRSPDQPETFNRMTVHVAPGHMRQTVTKIREMWQKMAPDVPIRLSYVDEDLAELYDADEKRGHVFAAFAVLAIVIACLGLFGLAAFSAERRTKEIGMRKVLGASVLDIVRLLVWQFSRPVLWANLIAWPVAFAAMQSWLSGFRYAIDLSSPRVFVPIFAGAGFVALAIAWLTIAGHAYKVARANPGRALRCE